MRYLLHHSDSTYDAATKRFTFTLDKRISNPVFFRVNKVTFIAPTADTYPSVVYLRSNALTSLSKTKHTVELKSDDHENNSNVLAVLEETHTKGRYAMKGSVSFPVHGHTSSRSIDVYFTDGTTVLAGESVPAPTGIADSDIVAIPYLKLWQDNREDTLLDSTYSNSPNIGDNVRYIYQNAAAMQSMVFAGYGDFQVASLGAGRGLVSATSWQYAIDGSSPNKWDDGEDITYVWSMKMAHTATTDIKILKHYSLEVEIHSGVLEIADATGTFNTTNLPLLPTKDYMITIRRMDLSGNGTYENEVTLENLETNVIQTATVAKGKVVTAATNWYYSTAQQHFWEQSGVLGPLIAFNNTTAEHVLNAQKWIRAQYDGDSTAEVVPPVLEDASFFVELEVKARNK
jgi:hypothetical protein